MQPSPTSCSLMNESQSSLPFFMGFLWAIVFHYCTISSSIGLHTYFEMLLRQERPPRLPTASVICFRCQGCNGIIHSHNGTVQKQQGRLASRSEDDLREKGQERGLGILCIMTRGHCDFLTSLPWFGKRCRKRHVGASGLRSSIKYQVRFHLTSMFSWDLQNSRSVGPLSFQNPCQNHGPIVFMGGSVWFNASDDSIL